MPASAQFAFLAPSSTAGEFTLPDGFYLEDALDATFWLPVTVAFLPDGRMLVVQKSGLIRIAQDGEVLPEPFLDLRDEVLDHHDRGLLGIAVDPDYETTRRIFVSYTVDYQSTADRDRQDAFARVASFRESLTRPNTVDPSSRRVLIGERFQSGIPSCYFSHTIGSLAVGSDGTLLVGAGDGAHYGVMDDGGEYPQCFGPDRLDPSEDIGSFRSQRLESLAGKVLRIDPETGRGLASNPFYTGDPSDHASKVWALGLRNPYRFTIAREGATDPAEGRPGTLYVGDVGWSTYEELNVVRGGENFGWPCFEGPDPQPFYQTGQPATNGCGEPLAGTLTDGAMVWHHREPLRSRPQGRTAKSLIGGAVVAGDRYPEEYRGRLFYADYSRGWTATARLGEDGDPVEDQTFSGNTGPVVSYVYDPFSRYLYSVDVVSGRIQRLRHIDEADNAAPVAWATAHPQNAPVGHDIQLSGVGSFDPDGDSFVAEWDLGDGRTTTELSPQVRYDTPGDYDARLLLRDGTSVTMSTVRIRVREGDVPTIRIEDRTRTARPRVGEAVQLVATVTDPDEGDAGLAVRWTVTQIHDTHFHPAVFEGEGTETFFIPAEHGANGDLVYYRVRAEVRDASGLTAVDEASVFLGPGPVERDVTTEATPRALSLISDLPSLTDGVFPPPGSPANAVQVRTRPSAEDEEDWIGLEFNTAEAFTRLDFVEGRHEAGGGWFERLGVQVHQDGEWRDVLDLRSAPEYRAGDDQPYGAYSLSFAPITGDAIRLIGPPGGSERFVTATELRAFVVEDPYGPLPAGWEAVSVGLASAPVGWSRGVFTIEGNGSLGQTQGDNARMVSRPLPVGGSLTARLGERFGAAAGLSVRESADPDAAMLTILTRPSLPSFVSTRHEPDAFPQIQQLSTVWEWLRLTRRVGTYTASVSEDGEQWQEVAQVPFDFADPLAGMVVSGSAGRTWARFEEAVVEPLDDDAWFSVRLGETVGAAMVEGNAVTVEAAGDLMGASDQAPFVYRPLLGDGSVSALTTLDPGGHPRAGAGLMLRASEDPGAPSVGLVSTARGLRFQFRARHAAPVAAPVLDPEWSGPLWLRLDREADRVAAFASRDGAAWTPIATVEIEAFTGAVLAAGLTAASGRDGETVSARFESYAVMAEAETPPIGVPPAAPLGFTIDRVFPNPARGSLTVRVLTPDAEAVTAELLDALGRQIIIQAVSGQEGTTDLRFDLDGVPSGVYLVRLTDAATGDQLTRRVTVVR